MKPRKIKTRSILKSLQRYAKDNAASVDILDFKLLKIETHIKTIHDKEFSYYNEDISKAYEYDEQIINEHVQFKQLYIIEIFQKSNTQIRLNYKVQYDEYKTDVDIILSKSSIIPYENYKTKDLYKLLLSEFDKIKAKEGILLNLFDELYIHKLKAFTKYLLDRKFTKSLKLPLIRAIHPNITQQSRLIMHYENKKNEHGICEVDAGEVIIEYIKPKFGSNGLNAFGEIVDAASYNNAKDYDKSIDLQTIQIKENDDKKLYIAKEKGYINVNKDGIGIDNKIRMQKISRTQEILEDNEANNIEVILKEHDSTKDGIGEGVELTSETIHVEGFVGSNSMLNATNLFIDGATHQKSKQFAKFATINRHKGTLRCHKADIKLLEGGEVHATTVNIDSCLGGSVYGENIKIKNVKNKVKIYASNSIKIDLVSGEDNFFTIDPKAIPILKRKIEYIDNDIEDLKFDLEEAQRHHPEKVKNIEDQIHRFKNAKDLIYKSVYNASIEILKPFRGLNTVTFVLEDNLSISYKTQAKKYDDFYLEVSDEIVTLKPTKKTLKLP